MDERAKKSGGTREPPSRRKRRREASGTAAKLAEYDAKRDFELTPEPRGARAARRRQGWSYVIQKHDARRLHHDFRLELDGVLLSWAVPKGPPTETGAKALAVRTEDHPLDYGSFEGVIPRGEYGAGPVMLWDRGSWSPKGDPRRALERGKLDFHLEGERLRGHWTLVRLRDGSRGSEPGKDWLLIKSRPEPDEQLVPPELDRSVVSGRTMEEILAGARPRADADSRPASRERGERQRDGRGRDGPARGSAVDPAALVRARRAPMPRVLHPQLATLVAEPPTGAGWLHELKLDGYRLLARLQRGRARLLTRNGKDWTERFPLVERALADLPLRASILDGEVVVLAPDGSSDFQALQRSLQEGSGADHVYFAFDLPYCEGYDLSATPLLERKRLLASLLAGTRSPALRFSEHAEGDGALFLRHACDLRLEGVVSKRSDARYEQRRASSWLKTKCTRRQEFVVGGWSEPGGSRSHFGALLVGVYDGAGELHYAGRVGTGFGQGDLRALGRRLAELEREQPAFVDPPRGADARGVHWVEPRLVVELSFHEWTAEGLLRHPAFQGVREDKEASEVKREEPGRDGRQPAARKSKARARKGAGKARSVETAATVAGVRLTHPERVLYPEQGITKRELAEYCEAVAEHLLPQLVERPLTLVRCPRGRAGSCFYQKHAGEGLGPPVRSIEVEEKDGSRSQYVAVGDLAGLLTLVQLGVLELHPWGARADRLERPDRLVLDLDPGPRVAWARVVAAAESAHALLDELGLRAFVRTTGGKGLHVVLPIDRRSSWPEAKQFMRDLAQALARREPEGFVLEARKSAREGRIFLDYLRNDRGATAVASYSPRAREGAPVATPVAWEELTPRLDPRSFHVRSVPERLARRREDPWEGFASVRQSLTREVREGVRRL